VIVVLPGLPIVEAPLSWIVNVALSSLSWTESRR